MNTTRCMMQERGCPRSQWGTNSQTAVLLSSRLRTRANGSEILLKLRYGGKANVSQIRRSKRMETGAGKLNPTAQEEGNL